MNESEAGQPRVGAPESPEQQPNEERTPWQYVRQTALLILIAFALALLIKTFLVQAFYIPSESMVPTLQEGDRVLVEKLFTHPHKGWIVVFPKPRSAPDRGWLSGFVHWLTEGFGVTKPSEEDLIKRVIALPGETIEIHQGGAVYVDGTKLDEPYVNSVTDPQPFGPCTVPEDRVFVLGDNRARSEDSRVDFGLGPGIQDGRCAGAISVGDIVGRAFVRIWPPSRIHWLA